MTEEKVAHRNPKAPIASSKMQYLRYGSVVGSSLLYWVVCFLCLVRWHGQNAWVRFDVFSGGYLLIKLLGSAHSLFSGRGAFRSEKLQKEWWGATSNSSIVQSTVVLMIGDLLIFWDYGHWQTLGFLARPEIQGAGLALYVLAKAWQMWADSYLARYFADPWEPQNAVLKNGPYRYIRHPRYAALIAGKVGCALIFASALGWLSLVAWAAVYVRKVEQEEEHMKRASGGEFDLYSAKTAKLIPRIY